jgi:hypothetical protein
MDNELILTDDQGTPAGYGDTVQYILDKLGEGQLGPELSPDQSVVIDQDTSFYNFTTSLTKTGVYSVSFTVSGASADFRVRLSVLNPSYQTAYITEDGQYNFLVSARAGTRVRLDEGFLSPGSLTVSAMSFRELKGTHALQDNSSLKPVRGRVPVGGRRNLLPSSDLSSDAWTKNQYTFEVVAGSPALIPVSGDLARYVFDDAGLPDDDYTAQVKAKKGSDPVIRVGLGGVSDGTWPAANFDADTGQLISANPALTVHETGLTDDGYFLFRVSSENCTSRVWLSGAADGSDTAGRVNTVGDGQTPALFVDLVQLESGLTPSSIQAVSANGLDIYEPGAKHTEYLRFDHVDDKLAQTFPDGFTGDLVVCGTEGSWIDKDVTVAAGSDLTIGPKNLPNTAGILPALGDIIGWVPVGKSLTSSEQRAIVDYYKGRGAKGKLVPSGVELVTNGTFDSDLSGWNAGSWVWDSGRALADSVASTLAQGVGSNGGEGKAFLVKWKQTTSGRIRPRIRDRAYSQDLYFYYMSGDKDFERVIISPDAGLTLQFLAEAGNVVYLDNVSVQELIPEEDLA